MYADPISDAQRTLIAKLCSEINPDNGPERALAFFETSPNRREASRKIDVLIEESKAAKRARRFAEAAAAAPAPAPAAYAAPAARAPHPAWPEPGYYAVYFEDRLRFYRVKEGKGYKAGRFFLDRFKSDELMTIRYNERVAVLDAINADPATAQMRFAKELTRCFCCGRMLTDELSRARGIGPDCFGRRNHVDVVGIDLLEDAL